MAVSAPTTIACLLYDLTGLSCLCGGWRAYFSTVSHTVLGLVQYVRTFKMIGTCVHPSKRTWSLFPVSIVPRQPHLPHRRCCRAKSTGYYVADAGAHTRRELGTQGIARACHSPSLLFVCARTSISIVYEPRRTKRMNESALALWEILKFCFFTRCMYIFSCQILRFLILSTLSQQQQH